MEQRRAEGSAFDPLGPPPAAAAFLAGPIAEEHIARRTAFQTIGITDWWEACEFASDCHFVTTTQWGMITRAALRLRSKRGAFLAALRRDLAGTEKPVANRTLRSMLNDAKRAVM
jgi:hypothetical protein